MYSLEIGLDSAREAQSMHPLWEQFVIPLNTSFPIPLTPSVRYVFPPEPGEDGVIDLCGDDCYFYFNPYAGQLS